MPQGYKTETEGQPITNNQLSFKLQSINNVLILLLPLLYKTLSQARLRGALLTTSALVLSLCNQLLL